jgi:glutamate-1-semialdehyde 2,1-aminomutase
MFKKGGDVMSGFAKSQALYERAKKTIPGGIPGHQSPSLLVPGQSPCFVERAEGARFWDVDGNGYIDYMCAYGPMIIGYNHPKVEAAAEAQRKKGNCFNLPTPLWVELAERLVELIPAADWAVFGKNGSDAMNHAVRVARAHTGKKKIAIAEGAYHGIGPWCTPTPDGITEADRAHVLTFPYNDAQALHALVGGNRSDLAAVIVTPIRHDFMHDLELPNAAFLATVNDLCGGNGGPLLIVDDVRCGFRLHMGGSAEYFGLKPHLTAFSKALGNGHPISACTGAAELMDAAGRVFFTGSFFTSAVPLAASLATLDEMLASDAVDRMFRAGEKLKQGMLGQAQALGLEVSYTGPVTMPFMTFADDPSFAKNKTFCARAYRDGVFFHPYHNWFLSAAHGDEEIEETLDATQKAFEEVKEKCA